MDIKKCNTNICRFVLFLMNCCANINYVRRMRIFSLESFFQDASNGLGHNYTISFYLGAMERLKSMFLKKNAFQFFTTTSWILSRSFPAVLRFLLFPFFLLSCIQTCQNHQMRDVALSFYSQHCCRSLYPTQ